MLLASLKGGFATIAGFKSPSPENYGLFGSSEVPLLLSSLGYNVKLGGPYDISPKGLYMVIAPEKPFSEIEKATVVSAIKRGAKLVVADETGMANSLTDNFGIKISGIYVIANDKRGHGWDEVVRVVCNINGTDISFITTRVSYIEKYPKWAKPLCWIDDPRVSKRYVLAVFGNYGKGKVLVIADSTLFANFMVKGIYPELGSTERVVKDLIRFMSPEKNQIIIDNDHYNLIYIKLSSIPYIFMNLLSAGASSLQRVLERARPYAASLALVSLAGGLAFFIVGPPLLRFVYNVDEDELTVSSHTLDIIVRDLNYLSRTAKNERLRALAFEFSNIKVGSYEEVKKLVRKLIKRLGDLIEGG